VLIKEALDFGAKQLRHYPSPRKEAALLLGFLLKKERTWIMLNDSNLLENAVEYFELVKRRVNGEPLEYILGKASFYSRDFVINRGVLIPRPETELLVDKAFGLMHDTQNPRIIEVGTGSGIIAIMLAILIPEAKIIATDISLKALSNAKENALIHKVEDRISFVHSAYMDGIDGEFDLLVSNPPYIANSAILEPHVLNEPHEALFGGEEGSEVLYNLLHRASAAQIKFVACEMGYNQKSIMHETLNDIGAKDVRFYKDLAGHDRGFSARIGG